jgi:hypothetical protein
LKEEEKEKNLEFMRLKSYIPNVIFSSSGLPGAKDGWSIGAMTG